MESQFNLIINEAIKLELSIAELYFLYYKIFPDDADFWWELSLEEKNHASLLKTVLQFNDSNVEIPEDMLPTEVEELVKSNNSIEEFIRTIEVSQDRTRAFQFAFMMENSTGELHYDLYMKEGPDSATTKLFQRLNGDDIDHAKRIRQYMLDQQIPREE